MEGKQAELEEERSRLEEARAFNDALAEDDETERQDVSDQREFLLMDYVDVYEQAIEGLKSQLDLAQEEFEIISEEKRLREEEEAAQAAQKAKENEYGDMKIAVDEAKADIKNAEDDLADLNARIEEC